jgi:hypothetical protein
MGRAVGEAFWAKLAPGGPIRVLLLSLFPFYFSFLFFSNSNSNFQINLNLVANSHLFYKFPFEDIYYLYFYIT